MYLYCSQSHPTNVFYGGDVLGESAIEYEDQIGPMVVHSYEVFSIIRAVVQLNFILLWVYFLITLCYHTKLCFPDCELWTWCSQREYSFNSLALWSRKWLWPRKALTVSDGRTNGIKLIKEQIDSNLYLSLKTEVGQRIGLHASCQDVGRCYSVNLRRPPQTNDKVCKDRGGGGGALQPKVDVTRNPNWGISDCKKN